MNQASNDQSAILRALSLLAARPAAITTHLFVAILWCVLLLLKYYFAFFCDIAKFVIDTMVATHPNVMAAMVLMSSYSIRTIHQKYAPICTLKRSVVILTQKVLF